ncbi:MAG: BON domain-containing protein [Nitrospirae bacterium]|nr:BON domain-containing protein [Nitrospirota bacterium]
MDTILIIVLFSVLVWRLLPERTMGQSAAHRRSQMNRVFPMLLLMFFVLAVFSVRVSMAGEVVGAGEMAGKAAGKYIDDSVITTEVKAIIVKNASDYYLKIHVTTTKGDVVLRGFIDDGDTEMLLVEKIGKINGVRSVKSLLRMEDIRRKEDNEKMEENFRRQ